MLEESKVFAIGRVLFADPFLSSLDGKRLQCLLIPFFCPSTEGVCSVCFPPLEYQRKYENPTLSFSRLHYVTNSFNLKLKQEGILLESLITQLPQLPEFCVIV
jgi:hypothetical protein